MTISDDIQALIQERNHNFALQRWLLTVILTILGGVSTIILSWTSYAPSAEIVGITVLTALVWAVVVSHACLDSIDRIEEINKRIKKLGATPLQYERKYRLEIFVLFASLTWCLVLAGLSTEMIPFPNDTVVSEDAKLNDTVVSEDAKLFVQFCAVLLTITWALGFIWFVLRGAKIVCRGKLVEK